ncbi:MAG: DUF420 domain-containing protein, partial [Myxococcota bacterium]
MDPKLLFWTGALLNMGVIVGFSVWGVAARRRGAMALHRRNMLVGVGLVLLFVLSYLVKLLLLGREDRSSWSTGDVWTLWIHELCVLAMLIAGGIAAWRGRKLATTRNNTLSPEDPPAPAALASGHRLSGWTAVVAALLAFLTAALVLAGIYHRA